MNHTSRSGTGTPMSFRSEILPFIDKDEQSNPWVDFPPPLNYTRASKRSESSSMIEKMELSDFAGWASFKDPIKSITIFGDMEGIVFAYWNGKLDVSLGNTSPDLKTEIQRLRNSFSPITSIAISRSLKGSRTLKVSSNLVHKIKADSKVLLFISKKAQRRPC
jgi:hypothetical protein